MLTLLLSDVEHAISRDFNNFIQYQIKNRKQQPINTVEMFSYVTYFEVNFKYNYWTVAKKSILFIQRIQRFPSEAAFL